MSISNLQTLRTWVIARGSEDPSKTRNINYISYIPSGSMQIAPAFSSKVQNRSPGNFQEVQLTNKLDDQPLIHDWWGSAPKIIRKPENLLRIFSFAETTIGTEGLFTRNLSGCNSQNSENELPTAPPTYRLPTRIPYDLCGEVYGVLDSFCRGRKPLCLWSAISWPSNAPIGALSSQFDPELAA